MRHLVSIAALVALLVSSVLVATVTAQDGSLVDLLPTEGDVGQGFVLVEERPRGLEEQATGFSNPGEAASLLAEWGWQENAFQTFQTAELTTAGAPLETLDISLTRFATADGASLALPYFLEDRAAILGQREFPNPSPIGDETRAVNGFYSGAYDFTLYVRSGSLLLRISAASLSGSPHAPVEQIARGIVERAEGPTPDATATQGVAAYLPDTVPLAGATCSRIDDGGESDIPAMLERFDGVPDAKVTLDALGWQEGAYRQFGCDNPAPSHVGWVNMGVLRFADAQSAADAVTFFAGSRADVTNLQPAPPLALGDNAAALAGPTVNGTEYTLFVSSGPLLFRVTGVAPVGDPRQDVEAVATGLFALSLGDQGGNAPAPAPQSQLDPAPTIAPLPTATPIPLPTATPVPTLVLLPTATPAPAIAPLPSPTAVPTTIPVMIPTATAVPTATAAPTEPPPPPPTATTSAPPTPTPRVIRPPTPIGG